jgi:hypothetical protein
MSSGAPAYGLWSLVLINVAVFAIQSRQERRGGKPRIARRAAREARKPTWQARPQAGTPRHRTRARSAGP